MNEADGEADFYLYDSEEGSFLLFGEVDLSQDRYIVLLQDDESVDLTRK